MTPPVPLLPEEKLAAIIQKQVDGGYNGWKYQVKNGKLDEYDPSEPQYVGFFDASHHILEILLDPEGLKAIWPECKLCKEPSSIHYHNEFKTNEDVAYLTLEAWLEGGAEAAIDRQFSLLPS